MIEYSTETVHPRDRLSYWKDVIETLFARIDFKLPDMLDATIMAREVNGIAASRFEISRADLTRTAGDARRDMIDDFHLTLFHRGTQIFDQEARSSHCSAGGLVLLDMAKPFRVALQTPTEATAITIPRKTLESRLGPVSPYLSKFLAGDDPIIRLVSAYIAALPSTLPEIDGPLAERVAEQILDMVGLAFASKSAQGLTSARAAGLARLKAAIMTGLPNPAFTAADACLKAGLSPRYANSLLAQEGTSVERLIYAMRLKQCRMALADKAQAHRTISDIAYSWGFSDQSHFTRRFKDAFGVTPRDFRVQSLQSLPRKE